MIGQSITFNVMLGTALLGATAGTIGTFAVLRRRALVGDMLSHAALPGICIAFMIMQDRNLIGLSLGALATGLLGCVAAWEWGRITRDTGRDTLAIGHGLLALAAPLSSSLAADHSHHHHGAATPTLQLNQGQKWATDAPLRDGMSRIQAAMEPRLAEIHGNRLNRAGYAKLAAGLEREVGGIVAADAGFARRRVCRCRCRQGGRRYRGAVGAG